MRINEHFTSTEFGNNTLSQIATPNLLNGVDIETIKDQSELIERFYQSVDRRRVNLITIAGLLINQWNLHDPTRTKEGREISIAGYRNSGFYELRIQLLDKEHAIDEINNVRISITNQTKDATVTDETVVNFEPNNLKSFIASRIFHEPPLESLEVKNGRLRVFDRNLKRTSRFIDGATLETYISPRVFKLFNSGSNKQELATHPFGVVNGDMQMHYYRNPEKGIEGGSSLTKLYVYQTPNAQAEFTSIYSNITMADIPTLINGIYLHYKFVEGKGELNIPRATPKLENISNEDILNKKDSQIMRILLQILPEEISMNQVIQNLASNRLPLDGIWNPFSPNE